MLGALAGVSPWWWVIAGLALGAAELLVFSYFLIWPALAALVVAAALALWPGMGGAQQVALFGVLALGLTGAGRGLLARRPAPAARLNRRADRLLGRRVRVRSVAGLAAEVDVDDAVWPARAEAGPLAPGTTVEVLAVDGVTLVVRPVPD